MVVAWVAAWVEGIGLSCWSATAVGDLLGGNVWRSGGSGCSSSECNVLFKTALNLSTIIEC